MSDYITSAEATTILRDLARGREDGDGGDVWPLYDRAEDAMRQVVALDLAATRLESERAAERTRADAAEADRDALRAECERLRAIVEGSTTAPTDAEIDAHWRAGGAWLVGGSVVTGAYEVRRLASLGIAHLTWIPLSGTLRGRTPCAWPVTP